MIGPTHIVDSVSCQPSSFSHKLFFSFHEPMEPMTKDQKITGLSIAKRRKAPAIVTLSFTKKPSRVSKQNRSWALILRRRANPLSPQLSLMSLRRHEPSMSTSVQCESRSDLNDDRASNVSLEQRWQRVSMEILLVPGVYYANSSNNKERYITRWKTGSATFIILLLLHTCPFTTRRMNRRWKR